MDPMSILLIASLVLLLGCLIALYYLKKSNQYKYSIYTKKKKNVEVSMTQRLYKRLENTPILNAYTRRIRSALEISMPGDTKNVVDTTVKIVFTVIAILFFLTAGAVVANVQLYTVVCILITAYVISEQILQNQLNRNETLLLRELDKFLDLLQFHFLQSRMVDEALHDSINGQNKLIELHARKILKIVQADDMDGEVALYNAAVSNKYLKELCMICVSTFTYGDTKENNHSVFLENIKRLKERLGHEMTTRSETQHRFRGQTLVCILPVYAIQPLMSWGISNIPALESYFNGYYAIVGMLVCTVVALGSYMWVNQLKSDGMADLSDHKFLHAVSRIKPIRSFLNRYYNENYGKRLKIAKMLKQLGSKLTVYTLAVKRALFAILAVIFTLIFLVFSNMYSKNHIRSTITGSCKQSTAADEEETLVMMLMVRGLTDHYLDEVDLYQLYTEETGMTASLMNDSIKSWLTTRLENDIKTGGAFTLNEQQALETVKQFNSEHSTSTKMYTAYLGSLEGPIREDDPAMIEMGMRQLEEMCSTAMDEDPLSIELFTQYVAADVADRVASYENAYFKWWYWLIIVVAAVIAFWLPYVWLIMNKANSQQILEAEVMQFMSTILVLMPVKAMSVQILLEWMLNFAVVFRRGLNHCIVNLPADEDKAFEKLIEEEPFEPFRDLVRSLEMVDAVGVHEAFSNLEVTRNNFAIQNEQHRSFRLDTNSSISGIVCMATMTCVLGLFLVYPFIAEAMGELTTTLYQMTSM